MRMLFRLSATPGPEIRPTPDFVGGLPMGEGKRRTQNFTPEIDREGGALVSLPAPSSPPGAEATRNYIDQVHLQILNAYCMFGRKVCYECLRQRLCTSEPYYTHEPRGVERMVSAVALALVVIMVLPSTNLSETVFMERYAIHSPRPIVSVSKLGRTTGEKSWTGADVTGSHPRTTGGYVAYTLDLCNNTLISGDWLPSRCGLFPLGEAYDSGKGEIFVTETNCSASPCGQAYLSVISDTTDHIVASVPIATMPAGAVYDDARGEVFVASYDCQSTSCGRGLVSVISDSTNQVVATIPVGAVPQGVAYDSGKGEIFVADSACAGNAPCGPGEVSVISDTTNRVVATVPVGGSPTALAYDQKTGEIFVANLISNYSSVISDTSNTVIATVPLGTGQLDIAYDSGQDEVFVSDIYPEDVRVISGTSNQVVATISSGNAPTGLAYDSGRGEVYVADSGPQMIAAISDTTNQVVTTIPLEAVPIRIVYDSRNQDVYVLNPYEGSENVVTTIEPSNGGGSWVNSPQFQWFTGTTVLAIAVIVIAFVMLGRRRKTRKTLRCEYSVGQPIPIEVATAPKA